MNSKSRFELLKSLYDTDKFIDLINEPDGIYWLKLKSLSRTEQSRMLSKEIGLDPLKISSRQLFRHLFEQNIDVLLLNQFINNLYEIDRATRRNNEDYLVSQLYKMKVFDWGGLYQNNLEQTIVNNYIKKISDWEMLNKSIENELHNSLRGYVQCSWYNHWSSILIEDVFNDHPHVLPTIGLVKKVDFFIHEFPFDLKVTYFPDGFMHYLRRLAGLRPEITELKRFCKSHSIWFDTTLPDKVLFSELLMKIEENTSTHSGEFLDEFKQIRSQLIQNSLNDPTELKIWLYENQGVRRFDASNRFFLILINENNLEESWKLKRNKPLLISNINTHLDDMTRSHIDNLKLKFLWEGREFNTYADILPIIV